MTIRSKQGFNIDLVSYMTGLEPSLAICCHIQARTGPMLNLKLRSYKDWACYS